MAGPFIVVVAGIATAWIAVSTNDGLVTEDYYKKGLAVNQTIAQSERATQHGLQAALSLSPDRLRMRLSASDAQFVPPSTLVASISHPTRAGLDQRAILKRQDDLYVADFRLPASGHWLVLVEDEARTWRLLGNVLLPAQGETLIGGVQPPRSRTGPANAPADQRSS
jgi:hypothetical protein